MPPKFNINDIQKTSVGTFEALNATDFTTLALESAEFMKEVDKKNAILGKSKRHVGIIGLSEGFTGVYGEGPLGIIGVSNSADGDGVSGQGRRGVVGESENFQGVYGHSKTNAGVVGESDIFDGLWGISHSSHKAGVFGLNKRGFGVIGHSESNTGVSGDSDTGIGVHGRGGSLAGLFEGNVEITGEIRMTNADFAEDFDVAEDCEPGEVVVLTTAGNLELSKKEYDKKAVGIISGAGNYKPGIILDKQNKSENRKPVAMVGKVYCKVDADSFPIEIGDMLTTSNVPGHAMKALDPFKAFGSIIGKALGSLASGKGLIPVLVFLQ